jgi:hypothetical protein
MQHSEALEFVEAIKGLIRQQINDARPGHQKSSRDDHDYETEIVGILTRQSDDDD